MRSVYLPHQEVLVSSVSRHEKFRLTIWNTETESVVREVLWRHVLAPVYMNDRIVVGKTRYGWVKSSVPELDSPVPLNVPIDVFRLVVSPTGKFLAWHDVKGQSVSVFDVVDDAVIGTFHFPNDEQHNIRHLGFSEDEEHVYAVTKVSPEAKGNVYIWNLAGKHLRSSPTIRRRACSAKRLHSLLFSTI